MDCDPVGVEECVAKEAEQRMKEDGENAGDGLHSSKRLRLSILRSQSRGLSRSPSDSAGPSHGASTSSTVNLPSISYSGVQAGNAVDVPESSIQAEPTSSSECFVNRSFGRSLENISFLEADNDSALSNVENSANVTDICHLHTVQQPTAAGCGLQDVPREFVDGIANQDEGYHERRLQVGTNPSMESIVVEPGAEVPVTSGEPVGSRHEHDDAHPSGEEQADDRVQGGEVSGDGSSNELQPETIFSRSPETEAELEHRPFLQQVEALSPNGVSFGQSEIPLLEHAPETSPQVVDARDIEGPTVDAEAGNQVVEVLEISDDNGEAESVDPALTASAFAEPRQTPEDYDAFAPEPRSSPRAPSVGAETSRGEHVNTQLDSEGTTCPICMEPWTSTGNHRICSLACGHLFGKSCIKRWLKLTGKKQGKCPHCNKRARIEDLRTLYVPRLAVMDEEGQEYMLEACSLRTENEQLKQQVADLRQEVRRTQALLRALAPDQDDAFSMFGSSALRPQDLRGHHTPLSRRSVTAQHVSRPHHHRAHGSANYDHSSRQSGRPISERPQFEHFPFVRSGEESSSRPIPQDQQNWRRFDATNSVRAGSHAGMIVDLEQRREENNASRPLRSFTSYNSAGSHGLEKGFVLQDQRSLHGAKVFDMDAQSQLLLVSGKPPDSATSSALTKMSLVDLSEGDCVNLPFGTGAIRDIRIAPAGTRAPGRLALVASLGKKLSIFSLESNNVVIAYTLPKPSWACAWDPCDPNRVYTGLQNGTLLTFDMRQTSSPLYTLEGLSSTPIHTLQYVPESRTITDESGTGGGRGLLSASSSSLLFWPGIDKPHVKRPVCLSQPGGSSICVSVAYSAAADLMVASLRPKPATVGFNDGASSSTPSTYSQVDIPAQPTSCLLPEPSVSVLVPTHLSFVRTRRQPEQTLWEQQQGAMVGHKSQAVLSRTAIVNAWTGRHPSQNDGGCLFASGDEGSNSVWLWDLGTPTAKQMLTSHPYSPVLDIRTTHVAGVDLLGCISERTLQLYRRIPE
ncbi:uncharacterized protein [Physcomitrium patens]|uniref:uncharacterized protein isoform X4 n=1 Tax=Physcomitrium patens TaxID=3218 RepID=UPI000D15357A|nr:uncharacterized protein LOC112275353 isoform X4 [Physcomitrium patens]|eukprot:XP_024361431.1 uncharacterized protein LOC112275353 isoform X4 [Physcomitrella patens]